MRLVYLALGARIGARSYGGTLLDPHPTTIGDRVTIGINAIVLPGVVVGDDAIIAAGTVVTKGTRIPNGTTWAGVPATQLGHQKVSGLSARPEVALHERRKRRRNRPRTP